jgi:hypothetical protein
VTKNEHICSMCKKINKVGKQEVGIWWIQKCFPRYGEPIWSLWPNIRSLPSTVTEKSATKNILDGRRTDRGKTVYPPLPSGSGGIKILTYLTFTTKVKVTVMSFLYLTCHYVLAHLHTKDEGTVTVIFLIFGLYSPCSALDIILY